MLHYYGRVLKAIFPRRIKDALAISVLVPLFAIPGYHMFFKTAPNVVVHTETTYPAEVIRGGTFYLNYDLSWDRSCELTAVRYVVASDNIEYKMMEDTKDVQKDQRYTFSTRIPIPMAIPPGKALVRSDFAYACDWWSRYISPIRVRGRDRVITIKPAE